MNLYRVDHDEVETPQEFMARMSWWNFPAMNEAYDEYGCDESCPFFVWADHSHAWLPDGSSKWLRGVMEPYVGINRFDNRDAFCGSTYFLLPASQRYGMRLTRWQEIQEAARPVFTCTNIDDQEPF